MPVSTQYATSFRSGIPFVSKPLGSYSTSSLNRGSRSSYEINSRGSMVTPPRDSSYTRENNYISRESNYPARENGYSARDGGSSSSRDTGVYSYTTTPSPSSSLRSTSSSSSNSSSSNYSISNPNYSTTNYSSTNYPSTNYSSTNYDSNYKSSSNSYNVSSSVSGLSPSSNVTLTRFTTRRTDTDSPLKVSRQGLISELNN